MRRAHPTDMGKPFLFRDRVADRAPSAFLEDHPHDAQVSLKKKKRPDARLWMRLTSQGDSELLQLDRNTVTKLVSIPARDLRILGPVFSQCSSILAREKAIVINLEFIKAIVTAEDVLILDPKNVSVAPFIDQLKEQLSVSKADNANEFNKQKLSPFKRMNTQDNEMLSGTDIPGTTEAELAFEFRVLEVALQVVCGFLDGEVTELKQTAYPLLDDLTRNVSNSNLEHVRSLKSKLTRLLARVQKVRDEMEHLLDDDQDMAHLYLTRKNLLAQEEELNFVTSPGNSPRASYLSSHRSSNASLISSTDDHNVEELEMLLEAYFVQIDGTRKKILAMREYIDDTEDYVNIRLDNQRNELIQLRVTLGVLAFSVSLISGCAGAFAVNIPCPLYNRYGIFTPFVTGFVSISTFLFFIILGYARWKGHFT